MLKVPICLCNQPYSKLQTLLEYPTNADMTTCQLGGFHQETNHKELEYKDLQFCPGSMSKRENTVKSLVCFVFIE